MGLDLSHDCWHGACSAFSRWRNKLAEVAGYDFHKIPMFEGGPPSYDVPTIDWALVRERQLMGDWDDIPCRLDGTRDPLLILITHYDTEGIIKKEHTGPLADRLEELLPLLGEEDGGGHVGSYAEKTEIFVKGLREASKRGERVTFH